MPVSNDGKKKMNGIIKINKIKKYKLQKKTTRTKGIGIRIKKKRNKKKRKCDKKRR